MSKSYTVTLTDAEDKALRHIAVDAQDWIDNVVHERCRIAMDEIVQAEVKRRLDAGETIGGSREDIVLAAPIKTLAEVAAEQQAAMAAQAKQ